MGEEGRVWLPTPRSGSTKTVSVGAGSTNPGAQAPAMCQDARTQRCQHTKQSSRHPSTLGSDDASVTDQKLPPFKLETFELDWKLYNSFGSSYSSGRYGAARAHFWERHMASGAMQASTQLLLLPLKINCSN